MGKGKGKKKTDPGVQVKQIYILKEHLSLAKEKYEEIAKEALKLDEEGDKIGVNYLSEGAYVVQEGRRAEFLVLQKKYEESQETIKTLFTKLKESQQYNIEVQEALLEETATLRDLKATALEIEEGHEGRCKELCTSVIEDNKLEIFLSHNTFDVGSQAFLQELLSELKSSQNCRQPSLHQRFGRLTCDAAARSEGHLHAPGSNSSLDWQS